MQEARKQLPIGVITQGQLSNSWMALINPQHAQEALDHIQELDDPLRTECEEAALILTLTLHSWTWSPSITLHDKTGPCYARSATCRPGRAFAGQVHLNWTPGGGDDDDTAADRVRRGDVPTRAEDPEQIKPQPPRPTPQQWTLYKLLTHACILADHSIQPYTDVTYLEQMLQDWPWYETEVLEGDAGRPATTHPTTWNDLVPNGEIGALAKTIQDTAPGHPFDDSYHPADVNAFLGYHSWTTQQHLHLHSACDDPCKWHPMGPPC